MHAFVQYAAGSHPEPLELCQRILAMPFKRAERRVVDYFGDQEMAALLPVPDRNTAVGRRDYALLLNANGLPARQEEALVEIVERGAGCGMAEEREPIWGTKLALPRGPSAGTAPESLKISKRKVPSRVSSQESGPTSMVGRSLPLHDRDPRLVRDLEPPEAAGTQCARRPRPSL